jgi:hypothetical protein
MKKPIVLVVVLAVIIIGAGGFYLYKTGKLFGSKPKEINLENKDSVLTKDDFSVKLPDGWEEVSTSTGAILTAIDSNEKIIDVNAQKLNFRSYFAVIYDKLGDKTKDGYYQALKDTLKQSFAGISFTKEEKGVIDNKDTYFVEAEFIQQEVNFKILLSINVGDQNVWIMSFNTIESNWENYKDIFYQTAGSFAVKKI